jgi:hypothetical protein
VGTACKGIWLPSISNASANRKARPVIFMLPPIGKGHIVRGGEQWAGINA